MAAVIVIIFIFQSELSRSVAWVALPVAGLFYFANMRKYLRRRIWSKEEFPLSWRRILFTNILFYKNLKEEDRSVFEKQVFIFVKEHRMSGIGTTIDDNLRILIASSAVILIFGRPEWEYRNLPEILIYPESFDRHYSFTSDRRKRNLAGIVVPQNAIAFSRKDLEYSFRQKTEPYHVGLHEFAHALDLADGSAEGIPANLNPAYLRQWEEIMQSELQRVRDRDSVLDPYAGRNSAELFAVAVEYFFEAPEKLRQSHSRLYEALASFLNQDPAKER